MPASVPTYRPSWQPTKQERDKQHGKARTDAEQQHFYNSRQWRAVAKMHLDNEPYCREHLSRGQHVPATMVHHAQALRTHPHLAVDDDNLVSLCKPCHSRLHAS